MAGIIGDEGNIMTAKTTTSYGRKGNPPNGTGGFNGSDGSNGPKAKDADVRPTMSGTRLCVAGTDPVTRKRMWRRVRTGKAVRVHRGIYADAAYWNTLNPPQRTLHVVEALSRRHPKWVFAGLTAAAVMNLDYTWSLLNDERIYVASESDGRGGYTRSGVTTIFVGSGRSCTVRCVVDGVKVAIRTTTPARTLVDCALRYPFRLVLGMFDAALRRRLVDAERVVGECDRVRADCGPVFRLLHYADARSENGGESLCRATLIDEGFAVPELQREFVDPANTWNVRRVDFVWHTAAGRVIVLEYDGVRKYVDPVMTNRRAIQRIVAEEKARDDMLLRAGVAEVVHVTYDEVVDRGALWSKLTDAGVPRVDAIPFYERG